MLRKVINIVKHATYEEKVQLVVALSTRLLFSTENYNI